MLISSLNVSECLLDVKVDSIDDRALLYDQII